MGPELSPQERVAFRRCVAGALLALALALGGQAAFGGPAAADSCSTELAPHLQQALARLSPELPLAQLGQYLGRALISRLCAD